MLEKVPYFRVDCGRQIFPIIWVERQHQGKQLPPKMKNETKALCLDGFEKV